MSDVMITERVASETNGQPVSGPASGQVEAPARGEPRGGPLLAGILAVATLAGALVAGIRPRLQRERELKAAAAEVSTSLPRVPVVTAKAASATAERVLPGDSHPLLEAAIYARTTGYLKSRRVDIGDRVKEGDLLAEIASPEVDAQLEQARALQVLARANLARDQASSELADTELQRSRKLLARQAAPQQEFEGFLARDKVADANVMATEANLRVNEANIHRLETLQSFQKVTAPFSGVITARNFDPGDLVSADSPPRPARCSTSSRWTRCASSRTSRRCSRPTSRSARRPSYTGGRTPSGLSPARSRERPTPWTSALAPC